MYTVYDYRSFICMFAHTTVNNNDRVTQGCAFRKAKKKKKKQNGIIRIGRPLRWSSQLIYRLMYYLEDCRSGNGGCLTSDMQVAANSN